MLVLTFLYKKILKSWELVLSLFSQILFICGWETGPRKMEWFCPGNTVNIKEPSLKAGSGFQSSAFSALRMITSKTSKGIFWREGDFESVLKGLIMNW